MEESETLEFKKSTSELKEAIISIVAILNKHQKGRLLFGVKNNGAIIGQNVTEKSLRDISKAISDHIEPKIYPKIEKERIDKKDCVVVEFQGQNIPYYAYGRTYKRIADEDKLMSARRFYNSAVKSLNVALESFPSNVIGNMFGFVKREFFELDEGERAAAEKPPKVEF